MKKSTKKEKKARNRKIKQMERSKMVIEYMQDYGTIDGMSKNSLKKHSSERKEEEKESFRILNRMTYLSLIQLCILLGIKFWVFNTLPDTLKLLSFFLIIPTIGFYFWFVTERIYHESETTKAERMFQGRRLFDHALLYSTYVAPVRYMLTLLVFSVSLGFHFGLQVQKALLSDIYSNTLQTDYLKLKNVDYYLPYEIWSEENIKFEFEGLLQKVGANRKTLEPEFEVFLKDMQTRISEVHYYRVKSYILHILCYIFTLICTTWLLIYFPKKVVDTSTKLVTLKSQKTVFTQELMYYCLIFFSLIFSLFEAILWGYQLLSQT